MKNISSPYTIDSARVIVCAGTFSIQPWVGQSTVLESGGELNLGVIASIISMKPFEEL
jgi:hypothetical protein